MKPAEIHEMTDEEMIRAIEDNQRELFNLRMRNQTGQVENTALIKQTRRDVARLLTEQTRRRTLAEA